MQMTPGASGPTPATPADAKFLSPEFSIVLDITRFLAALVVVAAHVHQDKLYLGAGALPMWTGHAAVLVFFVISGAVIAETALRPGQTLRAFALARFSRLYSVVIPAILLSYLLCWGVAAHLGGSAAEAAQKSASLWVPLSSALFLNESWNNTVQLPWNAPFWSLCYEAWYYALLAAVVFLEGRRRWIAVAILLLVAGPRILLLLPVWLLGVALVRSRLHMRLGRAAAIALLLVSVAGFLAVNVEAVADGVLEVMRERVPGWWRLGFSIYTPTDLVGGVFVTLIFVAVRALARDMATLLQALAPTARVLAGFSFSLYLFHRPITKTLNAYGVSTGDSFVLYALLLAAIVAACYGLSLFTERKRNVVQALLNRLVAAFAPRVARST